MSFCRRMLLAAPVLAGWVPAAPALSAQDGDPPLLEPGRPVAGAVRLEEDLPAAFRVEIPDDAVAMEVRLAGAEADLDLLASYDQLFPEEFDYRAGTDEFNEVLRIDRWQELPLAAGTYYVYVDYTPLDPPRVGGRTVAEIPFEISLMLVRAAPRSLAAPGATRAETDFAAGGACFFSLAVPESASCLRLDLADVDGDLDLYLGRGGPVLEVQAALHQAASMAGRESLLIDGRSDPPLEPGTYHLTVIDKYGVSSAIPFTIHVSFEPEPPRELLPIPDPPRPATPLERAVFGTVELISSTGSASGTLVTPDGLVLTSYHVIEGQNGKPAEAGDLIVALTLDPRQPPTELFRASVVEADKEADLALVEVISGLYGQPIPEGYRFAPVPLGDAEALRIGDPLWVLGFPEIGGTQSRVSITVTRGIVSGFDALRRGRLIKTDAQFHAGSSGGCATNECYELVGVPSETVQETYVDAAGQLGFVRPLSLMPASWRSLIDVRTRD